MEQDQFGQTRSKWLLIHRQEAASHNVEVPRRVPFGHQPPPHTHTRTHQAHTTHTVI